MPEAQADIAQAYNYIAARSPLNAVKWMRGLNGQIDSLEQFPRRCGRARE
jgi:plasmid stabilization system protein ParE